MTQKTFEEVLTEDAGSLDAVLSTIHELRQELCRGATDDWENQTLEAFLEAMRAWLEATGPRVGSQPSWKFVELMLRAAKVYE